MNGDAAPRMIAYGTVSGVMAVLIAMMEVMKLTVVCYYNFIIII